MNYDLFPNKELVIDLAAEWGGVGMVDIIKVVQGDVDSRFIRVRVVQNGMPYPLPGLVRISARKPSGFDMYNDAVIIDATAGLFIAPLTSQMLAEMDLLSCQFHFFKEDETAFFSTRAFTIPVDETLLNWAAVESSNEFHAVLVLFQDVADVRAQIGEILGKVRDIYNGLAAVIGLGPALSGVADGMARIEDKLNSVPPVSVIKSIQRDYIGGRGKVPGETYGEMKISLNPSVNPSKCKASVYGCAGNNSGSPAIISLTTSTLTVAYVTENISGSNYISPFSWEVVEYL